MSVTTIFMSKSKKVFKKEEKTDDSLLSKNHSKSIRYRLRVQRDKEAEQELKEFDHDDLHRDIELSRSHEA